LKKILVLTLSLIFVMALAATATAGIRNTVHDFQSGTALSGFGSGSGSADATSRRGMCSYCHIPHSSKGDRLWPATGDANVTNRTGVVGVLCASCHNGLQNANNTRSPMGARNGVDRSSDVYNTLLINHVLIDDGVYANNTNQNYVSGGAQFGQTNTWPYCATQGVPAGTSQQIECSSCHNPHSEQFGQSSQTTETGGFLGYGNDYLRANFYNTSAGIAFCEYCHEEKTRNTSPAGNTIMSGTHPVGTTANAAGAAKADIHIESAERVTLRATNIVSSVQYDMGLGTGASPISPALADNGIGNHLTSYGTGGVTCQTCHKVHGAQRGTGNAWTRRYEFTDGATVGSYNGTGSQVYLAASDDGNCNILAVENDANGGTTGYSYPTEGQPGGAGDYNDLCVDCHETTPSLGPNWVASNDVATNTGADTAVGAGRVANDAHPVNIAPDGLSETGFRLTVQHPSWGNAARWAGTTNTRRNHSFTNGGRWAGVGISTPANRSEIICMTCHSLHDGIKGTPILRASSTTYCVDCHTQSVGAVSHPVGYGSAMRDNPENVNWPNGDNLPLADYYTGSTTRSYTHSNGNTVEDMECYTCHAAHDGVDSFMLRIKDDNSRICVGCHTDFVAQGQENPGNYISEYNDAANARLGSHYTGTVVDSNATIGETRWTYSGAWTDTDQGIPASYKRQTSHWAFSSNGGTNVGSSPLRTGLRMQCQSCHTPHNAASGLEEPNVYDGTVSPVDWDFPGVTDPAKNDANFDAAVATSKMCATPTSALLLGNNGDSKMCATCHWPTGTHVTTIYTVPAKPDPVRGAGANSVKKKYRDFCTRTGKFIISVLRGEQETQYNVYDLIADGSLYDPAFTYDGNTPESPCNFPPLLPGRPPTSNSGTMVCDSCHTPHGAVTGAGAFILEGGTGSASAIGAANQRVATRNYQALCWLCHDK